MPPENPKFPSKSMTPAQHAVIKRQREVCEAILHRHLKIEQDYRNGLTCREIAIKYNVDRDYNVGISLARASVCFAIKKLIPDIKERENLAQDHNKSNGLNARDQRKGIHALSPQHIAAYGMLGASQGGKKAYENRLGVHALTPEKRKVIGQKCGLNAVKNKIGFFALSNAERIAAVKRGQLEGGKVIPWDSYIDPETGLNEGDYCDRLIRDPQCHLFRGGNTKIRCKLIAQLLNEKFHGGKQIRTKMSISHRLKKSKKTYAVQSTS